MSSKSARNPKKRQPKPGEIDLQIAEQLKTERAARDAQAVGSEDAPDVVEIGGVRFFRPTLAHVWFFNRLQSAPECSASLIDFAACLVAAITMPQAEVRNILMPAIDKGTVVQLSYDRLIDFEVTVATVNDAYEQLWQPLVSTPAGEEESAEGNAPASPAGGPK
jgi:hypothetical protein